MDVLIAVGSGVVIMALAHALHILLFISYAAAECLA